MWIFLTCCFLNVILNFFVFVYLGLFHGHSKVKLASIRFIFYFCNEIFTVKYHNGINFGINISMFQKSLIQNYGISLM